MEGLENSTPDYPESKSKNKPLNTRPAPGPRSPGLAPGRRSPHPTSSHPILDPAASSCVATRPGPGLSFASGGLGYQPWNAALPGWSGMLVPSRPPSLTPQRAQTDGMREDPNTQTGSPGARGGAPRNGRPNSRLAPARPSAPCAKARAAVASVSSTGIAPGDGRDFAADAALGSGRRGAGGRRGGGTEARAADGNALPGRAQPARLLPAGEGRSRPHPRAEWRRTPGTPRPPRAAWRRRGREGVRGTAAHRRRPELAAGLRRGGARRRPVRLVAPGGGLGARPGRSVSHSAAATGRCSRAVFLGGARAPR